MRKHTTLDLDQSLVREASAVLGTSRTTDTVHAALADVVARRRRALLVRMDLPDLTPEALDEMRAARASDGRPLRAEQQRPTAAPPGETP